MQFVNWLVWRRNLRLAFLVCVVGLCTTRVTSTALAGDPADQLHRIESFALGGIGFAGTMSEGEQALRALLHDPNATAQLQKLLTNATPAGQLYALLGLRARDRAAYDRALRDFKVPNVEVQTIGGCIIWHAPFKQLLDRIKAGEYDHSLERSFGN